MLIKIGFLVTAVLVALVCGLFYSYSCSVSLGLKRLPDPEYLRAMQEINRAILNLWFFLSFMGSLVMLPVMAGISYWQGGASQGFFFLLAAAIVYIIGVFGVTIAGNVPLNNMLDKFNIGAATTEQLQSMRMRFEAPWNRLNLIRTLANILSFVLLLISFFKTK